MLANVMGSKRMSDKGKERGQPPIESKRSPVQT